MQGTKGRSYSELCFALNNTADESFRLARFVWACCLVVAQKAKSKAQSQTQIVKINAIK